jgi:hypothetical protein
VGFSGSNLVAENSKVKHNQAQQGSLKDPMTD